MNSRDELVRAHIQALLSRYSAILPNPDALAQVLHQPLHPSGWLNPLKISRSDFIASFDAPGLRAMTWCDNGFYFDPQLDIGKSWQYLTGLLQIQEEVSMLPTRILAPEPSDCVLDMCAAPGNKTAQMATMMGNRGTLIANDINYQRLKAMGQINKRLGLMNINIMVNDAQKLTRLDEQFDKVLLDAPCTCEGTLRKKLHKLIVPRQAASERMAVLQVALLKKAIQMTRPGGRIVYSTCTFAPEENECVLDTVLKPLSGQVDLVPVTLEGVKVQQGVTEWQGRKLLPSLKRAWRIWPHLNNTGGFFIALLEKSGPARRRVVRAFGGVVDTRQEEQFKQDVSDRFAIDQAILNQFQYAMPTKRGLYATHQSNLVGRDDRLQRLALDAKGMFFYKTKIQFPKLTTAAVGIIGEHAKSHVVHLNHSQMLLYLQRETQEIEHEQCNEVTQTGYVIVMYQHRPIGLGIVFYRNNPAAMPLRSLFPKYGMTSV